MDLEIGKSYQRTDISKCIGGKQQGRISGLIGDKVLIFKPYTDSYRSVEGVDDEGIIHIIGEGGKKDQVFKQGNRSVVNNPDAKFLLFDGDKDLVTYLGEMNLVEDEPYYTTEVRSDKGLYRKVIVFQFKPLSEKTREHVHKIHKLINLPEVNIKKADKDIIVQSFFYERLIAEGRFDSDELTELRTAYYEKYMSLYRSRSSRTFKHVLVKPKGTRFNLECKLYDSENKIAYEIVGRPIYGEIMKSVANLMSISNYVECYSKVIVIKSEPMPEFEMLLLRMGFDVQWYSTPKKKNNW